jgi:hypothetical protein
LRIHRLSHIKYKGADLNAQFKITRKQKVLAMSESEKLKKKEEANALVLDAAGVGTCGGSISSYILNYDWFLKFELNSE